jgi:hypothetical protein
MKKIFRFKEYLNEVSSYHNLHGDDEYNITKVDRDNYHDYEYCDGILYELSGNDTTVSVDNIEATDENLFYEDQIERYMEYIQDGGIIQTFPVKETSLGDAYNLSEMFEYLDESDNFDLWYDLLIKYEDKLKEIDKDLKLDAPTLSVYPEKFGLLEDITPNIRNIGDIDKYLDYSDIDEFISNEYGDLDEEDYKKYKEKFTKIYDILKEAFKVVLEYWKDNGQYTLTDFNHRFEAVKRLGKKYVLVEVI